MTPQQPKILLVDDKPQNLYTLQKLLEKLDVKTAQAESGFAALKLLLEHEFCLAIVDVQMPEMDGYELVELLRGNESTESLPVIFVSAIYSDEYHHRRGYEAGAVDFLSKPFVPEILLSKVRVFLDLYHQRLKLQELIGELNAKNDLLEREIEQRQQAETALTVANKTLSRRAVQLETSSQVGQRVTSILSLQELLPVVVNLIQSQFGYYFVGVWLLDETRAGVVLEVSSSCEACGTLEPGFVIPVASPRSVIASVCQSGHPHLATNIQSAAGRFALRGLPNTRSELTLPLHFGARKIGVLDIHSEQREAFDPQEQAVLQTLADQIAIAIHNARLYDLEKNLSRLEAEKAQELAELNASKDRIFAIVAHDLKSPFNPLLGLTKLLPQLVEKSSPAEVKQVAENIYQAAQNIYNLLENLLQWSRLQRGRIEHEPTHLSLKQLVAESAELLAPNAAGKGIGLCSAVAEGIMVYADPHMLETVIRNLLSNALKFTPPGGQVTVSARPTSPELAEVAVSDTGIGITPADQAKLFRPEVIHTTPGTAHEEGTGLGLIICRDMVEKNGGRIWIESEPGQGATVKFTVPRSGATAEEAEASRTTLMLVAAENGGEAPPLPPHPEELNLLRELMLQGNMLAIEERANQLEALDQQYGPFARQIRRLARSFEEDQLQAFIEQYPP